jgi:beta-lactamase regulating signal transducer with metallopeptidase domain
MEMSILTWVLTYAVHSSVLLGGVWLLCTLVPRLSLSTRESLWKIALLGGMATTSLHMGFGVRSPWDLSLPAVMDTNPAVVRVQAPAADEPVQAVEREIMRHHSGDMTITTIRERRAATATPVSIAREPARRPQPTPWPWVILALVALGSLYAGIRLMTASARLRRQLRGRRDVIEDPLLETFLCMCQKVGLRKRVKLSASAHLQSPVALVRREIVLPERAVDSLDHAQQESMLAHELAHVLRRDPVWLWIAAVVEAVFFFQPLNHLARRRIQHLAELQCDDWAARHTGTGVHLAKCLAEVAAWVDGGPPLPSTVSAMAGSRSPIVRRITRLLDDRKRKTAPSSPAAGFALGVALLGFVTWLAPGIGRAAVVLVDRDATPTTKQAAVAAGSPQDVTFREVRGENGRDRAHVRVQTSDEIVEVEIDRPRPPEPPPIPERARRRGLHIVIEGSVWGGLFDPHVEGSIELDLRDLDVALDDLFDFPFSRSSWETDRRRRHRSRHERVSHGAVPPTEPGVFEL